MLEVLIQKLLESLYIYYGLDWLSFGCGAWGMYLISEQRRAGFVFQMVAALAAIGCSIIAGQFGFIAANCLTFIIVSYGYYNWKKDVQFQPRQRKDS